MAARGFKVRALGEIAIRCADLAGMTAFYRDVIGLEILAGDHRDGIVFFRISEGFAGHTAVLALFRDAAGQGGGPASSLHHLALSLPRGEQDAVLRWYEARGQDFHVREFPWIGWRGIFTTDPEGNTVELVAHDPALG
jgi:catechol-2,3-dioxygenase